MQGNLAGGLTSCGDLDDAVNCNGYDDNAIGNDGYDDVGPLRIAGADSEESGIQLPLYTVQHSIIHRALAIVCTCGNAFCCHWEFCR